MKHLSTICLSIQGWRGRRWWQWQPSHNTRKKYAGYYNRIPYSSWIQKQDPMNQSTKYMETIQRILTTFVKYSKITDITYSSPANIHALHVIWTDHIEDTLAWRMWLLIPKVLGDKFFDLHYMQVTAFPKVSILGGF